MYYVLFKVTDILKRATAKEANTFQFVCVCVWQEQRVNILTYIKQVNQCTNK